MSHVPTVLKSDRSVFDKMLPVDDNGSYSAVNIRVIIGTANVLSNLTLLVIGVAFGNFRRLLCCFTIMFDMQ